MRLILIPPLSDAYFHLNQAKGLPSIASSRQLRRVYVTSCIQLSWIALEVAVADRIKTLAGEGRPAVTGSKGLLESAKRLAALGGTALDLETFRRLRKLRNEIVHPRSDDRDVDIPVGLAIETLDFCSQIIRDLYHPARLIYESGAPLA